MRVHNVVKGIEFYRQECFMFHFNIYNEKYKGNIIFQISSIFLLILMYRSPSFLFQNRLLLLFFLYIFVYLWSYSMLLRAKYIATHRTPLPPNIWYKWSILYLLFYTCLLNFLLNAAQLMHSYPPGKLLFYPKFPK